MIELLTSLIDQGGPLVGTTLFVSGIALTWGYHGLLRQVATKQNRIALLLVDKDIATMKELREYGILVDVGGVMGIMEGLT